MKEHELEQQWVRLDGGSFDGMNAMAQLPPYVLRLGAESGEEKWTELYRYVLGRTADDPQYGPLPVMAFESRDAEID